MATKQIAAESIRRLAIQYQDMVAAAEALESIGSVEGAAEEAVKARAAAEKERDAVKAELAAAKEKLKDAKADALALVEAGKAQAQEAKNAALDEAAVIIADGKLKALEIIKAAEAQSASATADVTEKLSAMNAKLKELSAEVDAAILKRDDAEAQSLQAQQKLESVQDTIRKLAGV